MDTEAASSAAAESTAASSSSSSSIISKFPKAFTDWVTENKIDPANFEAHNDIPRFIRLNPRKVVNLEQIEKEIGAKLEPVPWLKDFYQFPSSVKIATTEPYKRGDIYGLDAASGAAVQILDPAAGDIVLDLCCAPGMKLCMIADRVFADDAQVTGFAIGVDVNAPRLASCRTVLQKYGITNTDLWLGDGRTFDRTVCWVPGESRAVVSKKDKKRARKFKEAPPPPHACLYPSPRRGRWQINWRGGGRKVEEEEEGGGGGGKEEEKEGGGGEKEKEQVESESRKRKENEEGDDEEEEEDNEEENGKQPSNNNNGQKQRDLDVEERKNAFSWHGGYDKVLVDADCTHDGSVKHVAKFENWGWETFEQRFFDQERVNSLDELQKALLTNGFRLLKEGGVLVYSTCSMTISQNEGVVSWFLETEKRAQLIPIEHGDMPCREGGVAGTVRFDPLTSKTSALYVAKFTKKAPQ